MHTRHLDLAHCRPCCWASSSSAPTIPASQVSSSWSHHLNFTLYRPPRPHHHPTTPHHQCRHCPKRARAATIVHACLPNFVVKSRPHLFSWHTSVPIARVQNCHNLVCCRPLWLHHHPHQLDLTITCPHHLILETIVHPDLIFPPDCIVILSSLLHSQDKQINAPR
jgi:hypothetical protein